MVVSWAHVVDLKAKPTRSSIDNGSNQAQHDPLTERRLVEMVMEPHVLHYRGVADEWG